MDLYEALKAGATEEDLLKTFHEELDQANNRISKEKEAALHQELLDSSREDFVEAFLSYIEVLLDEDFDEEVTELITKSLQEFEKSVGQTKVILEIKDPQGEGKILKTLKSDENFKYGDKIFKTLKSDVDDDFLAAFLKTLK